MFNWNFLCLLLDFSLQVAFCSPTEPTLPPELFWVSTPDLFWGQYSAPAHNGKSAICYSCTLSLQDGFSCLFLLRQTQYFYALFLSFYFTSTYPQISHRLTSAFWTAVKAVRALARTAQSIQRQQFKIGHEVKKTKQPIQKLKILIFMSLLTQGRLPLKSAPNLLYFSSSQCSAAQCHISSREMKLCR